MPFRRTQRRTKCPRGVVFVGAMVLLPLFACNGDPSGPGGFFFELDGLVLEYTDATRTATRPVPDLTWVGVILPDGETNRWCDWVDCYITNFVTQAYTFTDALSRTAGHYSIQLQDPAHCELRLRAWEQAGPSATTDPGTGTKSYIYSGKTATVPRLAEPSACTHGRIEENGPTIIVE